MSVKLLEISFQMSFFLENYAKVLKTFSVKTFNPIIT